MRSVTYWATRPCLVFLISSAVLVASCSKTPPAAPTPPTPPAPIADAPSVTCGEGISRATLSATGLAVDFDTPTATAGQGTVNVSCTPGSGENFPIGSTSVTCTATDSLNRTGTCSFNVTVSRIPQLTALKYMAFGDSITAGEVSSPATAFYSVAPDPGKITKAVLVPSASWPTVLSQTLRGRYSTQTFTMANRGLSGERAAVARTRYQSALNAERPEVVMILHGHNDIPGGLDGAASTAAFEIEQMVFEAKNRGMRVFLSTVLPARPSGNRAIAQVYIDDFNARLRIVASRQGVTLVDNYSALRTDVNRYIGVDGLHPTEAGYAKVADTFFQAIQANLEVR